MLLRDQFFLFTYTYYALYVILSIYKQSQPYIFGVVKKNMTLIERRYHRLKNVTKNCIQLKWKIYVKNTTINIIYT